MLERWLLMCSNSNLSLYLCQLSFEKIIATQLCQYFEDECVLSSSQYDYRRERNIESAQLKLSELLFTARQNGKFTSLTAIDISKAFECISHSLLLEKLSLYKIGPRTVQWFDSYLKRWSSVRTTEHFAWHTRGECFMPPSVQSLCWAENKIFLRLKADWKAVDVRISVARNAKVLCVNKSRIILD